MDFKSLIQKIESLDDKIDRTQIPEAPKKIILDEDLVAVTFLAGTRTLSEAIELNEKAMSINQQQAAGAALSAKRGDTPKSELKGASKEMMNMSTAELEKIAGTKHKGLPEKKTKEAVGEAKFAASGVRATGKKKGDVERTTKKQYFVKLEKDGKMKGVTMTADEGESQGDIRDRAARENRSQGWSVVSVREKGNVDESFYDKFTAMVEAKKSEKDDQKKEKKVDEVKKEKMSKKDKKMHEAAKPDFLDLDNDGNTKEKMKDAAKDEGGDKKDSEKKGMSAAQEKYFGKKNESKMMPKGKKRPVKESVEQKLSFKEMIMLVQESGGQQQIDAVDKKLFAWAERVAKSKLGEGMKAEVYAGLVYERMGGRFEMYDVLSENQ